MTFAKNPIAVVNSGAMWTLKKENYSNDFSPFKNAAGFAISVAVQLHMQTQASFKNNLCFWTESILSS
jgi:hypothetical protein